MTNQDFSRQSSFLRETRRKEETTERSNFQAELNQDFSRKSSHQREKEKREKARKEAMERSDFQVELNDSAKKEEKELTHAALTLASLRFTTFNHQTTVSLGKLIWENRGLNCLKDGPPMEPTEEISGADNGEDTDEYYLNDGNQYQKAQPLQEDANPIEAVQPILEPAPANNNNPVDNYIPPPIPPVPSLRGIIGQCSQPFEKQLTASDVNHGQCRLVIGKADFENSLKPLLREDENLSEGISVTVYNSNAKGYNMTFRKWQKVHLLNGGWKQFCQDHGFRESEDWVTIYMFRHAETGKLCFVITSRRLDTPEPVRIKRQRQK